MSSSKVTIVQHITQLIKDYYMLKSSWNEPWISLKT
jgi:hypothetical protein